MNSIRMFAALLLLAPVPAFSDALTECLDRSLKDGAVHGDAYCYAAESERLDKEVEVLFAEKLRQLDSLSKALAVSKELQREARHNFTEAQAHWTAYRDAACRFEGDSNLGTGRPRAYSSCRIELDKRRIADLEASGF
ncbi:lysozyme inhibitor LprI family protein [Ralstonia solanacearum]|uniref:lysozyme inhibitor LprI family protein n=1 Tax=Ralstonia solanacearum TaxID=305 RepID=UPI0018D16CBD|nr:lysozyme inhibitor LprI family protein [Ralstonia solanacearum]